MAIDGKLRSALLKKLDVSPQRLSQRVKKIKQDFGPMSSDDAAYVIAHQEGLDLTKFLEESVVDRIRSLLPGYNIKEAIPASKEIKSERKKHITIKMGSLLPESEVLLSSTIIEDARKMAELFHKYYILENSIRVVIKRVLENKYGREWWDKHSPKGVRDKVKKRKDEEAKQPWHGKRGQHAIFYSDFGDLRKIIEKNWPNFEDFFPTRAWITQKLDELEHPRNVLAHHNPVSGADQQRIDLYFHDWISQLKTKKHLIP